jgi:hypothetical protein
LATLVSLVLHTAVFLLLALLGYSNRLGLSENPTIVQFEGQDDHPLNRVDVQLAAEDSTPPGQLPEQATSSQIPPQAPTAQSLATSLTLNLQAESRTTPANSLLNKLHSINQQTVSVNFTNTGVDGRRLNNRQQVALARGGSLASEQAVEAALQWLANHQLPSGAWSLVHDGGQCKGQCANPGCRDRFDPAATGLSLLAFLGAGYTHREGKYTDNVKRALYYLHQAVETTPQGASFLAQSERGMYNHGIATFALCEAYQLTGDPDLKDLCQQAIYFIESAQSYNGGWGYLPKQPGDLTISGWQMMALKSARAAKLNVESSTIARAKNFITSQRAKDGVTYFYREPNGQSICCTAIGVLLRMFLGDNWTDPAILEGLILLSKHRDYGSDIYFRYYTTLALFHAGGPLWEQWNTACREHLIATQASEGHESGSWYFENAFAKDGGRLYTTAMAAMTLEVYYRYAPLYQQTDQPFEL